MSLLNFIDDEDDVSDEIVEDPFISNEHFVPPKKCLLYEVNLDSQKFDCLYF